MSDLNNRHGRTGSYRPNLRKRLGTAYLARHLARHYIDAAAADGDGWMNLKLPDAECMARVDLLGIDVGKWAEETRAKAVAAPAKPPTVSDLLRELPVVEWRDDAGWWRQGAADNSSRWWWADLARWSLWGASVADPDRPARLVPASEADADPATRGPIDGSGGGA